LSASNQSHRALRTAALRSNVLKWMLRNWAFKNLNPRGRRLERRRTRQAWLVMLGVVVVFLLILVYRMVAR